MFRNNTTFIIGAGASAEFGLPVGSGLAKLIKKRAFCADDGGRLLRPVDKFLFELLVDHVGRKDLEAAIYPLSTIEQGLHTAVSIDAFIDRFKEDSEIAKLGKLLIAIEIADAERKSLMHPSQIELDFGTPHFKSADDTWIGSFVRILLDGVSDRSKIGNNITIICFNYDRCIEYYLVNAIANAYDIDTDEAEDIVSGMNIIHPYGTLGDLPWAANGNGSDVLQFGPDLDLYTSWFEIAKNNIRTYTEQKHDVTRTIAIHDAVGRSNVLVFLGFGFNNQNFDLLRVKEFSDYNSNPRSVYLTGIGISQQVSATLKRRIGNLFANYDSMKAEWAANIHIEYDQSCSQLFDLHSMNLSQFVEHYFDRKRLADSVCLIIPGH
ncbi:hypothetical protein ACQZ4Y_09315 [Rhizobium sp. L80/93]|uniref:hypothetical protein n=1 Tax=Rhizobium sp. E27B/91 TaxID=2819995 RepID=UPI001ADBD5F0|nr:hypothetical protein [Rhizobium sp. E27B/91]MBO9185597.1 hypothetical protein [Rhizobium sp. E27B/91]